MDNNERNPEIENSELNETDALQQENEVVQTENDENSAVASEYEDFLKQNESAEDSSAEPEAATELNLPAAENTDGNVKKKKNKSSAVILAILIVILLAATGYLIYFIVNSNSSSKLDLDKTVVTINGVENSAADYMQIFAYYYAYNSYYQYTDEQLKEMVLEEFIFMDTFYANAIAEGYTLTEEDQATIDDYVSRVTTGAEEASMTVDEYLEESVCKGYTLDMYRSYLEKQQIVEKYYKDNMEKIEAEFSGSDAAEKVEAEYAANNTLYDLCDVSRWQIDSTDENAVNADDIIAQVKAGKTFDEAIATVTGDSDAKSTEMKGYTYDILGTNFSQEAADWMFEKNDAGAYVNGTGSVTTVESNGMTYILYVNNAPSRDMTVPATVQYIQVTVGTDTTINTEAELKVTAKASATKILNDFNSGDRSAEAFEALVDFYADGEEDLITAAVLSNVTNDGSSAPEIEAWAADTNRKAGDCEVVEGDDCYYVLFFVERAKNPVWYQSAYDNLVSNAKAQWQENIVDLDNTEQAVTDDEAIDKIIAYVKELAAATQNVAMY